MDDSRAPTGRPAGWGLSSGVVTGAGIGLIFGILLDQLALGLIIGAGIGLVVATTVTGAATAAEARRGRVIVTTLGLVTAGLLTAGWILSR